MLAAVYCVEEEIVKVEMMLCAPFTPRRQDLASHVQQLFDASIQHQVES